MKKYSKLAIAGFIFELIGLFAFIYPIMIKSDKFTPAYGVWLMLLGGICAQASFNHFYKDPNLLGKTLSKITMVVIGLGVFSVIAIWISFAVFYSG